MIIESNPLAISKCMFQTRQNWKFVTEEQKQTFFFIFNRYFSKRVPELSQLLNDKTINKVLAMDLWFHFMEGQPYPNWFWSKSEKPQSTGDYSEKEINLLLSKFNLKFEELELLLKYYPDEVKEELKYQKDIEKKL